MKLVLIDISLILCEGINLDHIILHLLKINSKKKIYYKY